MRLFEVYTVEIETDYPEWRHHEDNDVKVAMFKDFLDEEITVDDVDYETRLDYYFDMGHVDYTGEYEVEFERFPNPQINFKIEGRDHYDAKEFEKELFEALTRGLEEFENIHKFSKQFKDVA